MTTPEISTALAAITTELIAIARSRWTSYEAWCESEKGILHGQRVRELGAQADRIAGFKGMSLACSAVQHVLNQNSNERRLADACASELNFRWHGIGAWRC